MGRILVRGDGFWDAKDARLSSGWRGEAGSGEWECLKLKRRGGRFRVDRSAEVGRGDGTGYGAPREENRSGMLQT